MVKQKAIEKLRLTQDYNSGVTSQREHLQEQQLQNFEASHMSKSFQGPFHVNSETHTKVGSNSAFDDYDSSGMPSSVRYGHICKQRNRS